MSLETWKSIYYLYPAHDKQVTASPLTALHHSLRKWYGLRHKNLEAHGLYAEGRYVCEPDGLVFPTSSGSCALCVKFFNDRAHPDLERADCPLVLAGFERCNHLTSAYSEWRKHQDPERMIYELEETVKWVKR